MALCHDERDYAMGFSRHNPHVRRSRSWSDRDKEGERKKYLKSLTPHQKKAYDRLQFFLKAVGQYFVAYSQMVNITHKEMHRLFPLFAKEMGWVGPFYRQLDEKCPAVSISYPVKKNEFWFITPYHDYEHADEDEQKPVHTKKARRAALKVCKAWLPDWKWDNVVLPAGKVDD